MTNARRDDRLRFRLLAALQFAGGAFLLAFAAFPTAMTPWVTDLVLGTASIVLGVVSWFWLSRLPEWTVHTSLVGSTLITGLLVYGMPTDQGQVLASYGFVLVVAFAATFFQGRALALHLALVVLAWVAATALNRQLLTPLVTIVVALIIVMIGAAFAYVTEKARATGEQMRAVWQSQIDPFVILEAVRGRDGEVVDLRYLEANDAAVAELGLSREQLLATTVLQILPDQRESPLFAACLAALESGEPVILHALPAQDERFDRHMLLDVRAFRTGSALALTWANVTDQVRAKEELSRRATTDDLTGFLTRRVGLEQLQLALADRRSGSAVSAVLFCDLDRFKEVNDTHGHMAGDVVLRTVSERIRSAVRDGDLTVRFGGDEFLVVLRGPVDDGMARTIAENVRSRVVEPIDLGGQELRIDLCIGVTRPAPGDGVDDIVARADAAMYRAKKSGRGQVLRIPETERPPALPVEEPTALT